MMSINTLPQHLSLWIFRIWINFVIVMECEHRLWVSHLVKQIIHIWDKSVVSISWIKMVTCFSIMNVLFLLQVRNGYSMFTNVYCWILFDWMMMQYQNVWYLLSHAHEVKVSYEWNLYLQDIWSSNTWVLRHDEVFKIMCMTLWDFGDLCWLIFNTYGCVVNSSI